MTDRPATIVDAYIAARGTALSGAERQSWLDRLRNAKPAAPRPPPYAVTPAMHPASVEEFNAFSREFVRPPERASA
jgi:hypothetical protein